MMMIRSFLKNGFMMCALTILGAKKPAQAEEIVYNMVLKSVLGNVFSPDCQNVQNLRRTLFLAEFNETTGPTLPGGLIEATQDDIIVVKVTNDHPTMIATIHFHGVHQEGTPWSDGPAQITQCPLGPLQSQEYRFVADPPGTHYWHAHAIMDVADGLSGPIIIHPKEETLEYDDERMLFLQDFYSETGEQQRAGLDNFPFTWIGNPDSLLINGRGLAAACTVEGADPLLCLDTCNDTLAWLPTIEVEANTTYRFRIINSGQLIFQNVAIVDHNMTIVEIEGTIIDPPITVANYDVAPGQRVSVLITTDQEPGSYLIETSVRERNITGLFGRAILQYSSVEKSLPTISPEHPLWNVSDEAKAIEDSLFTKDPTTYSEAAALQAPEDEIQRWVIVGTQNLRLDESGQPVQLRWALNNVSHVKPTTETLIARAVRVATENGWPTDLGEEYLDIPQLPPSIWNYSDLIDLGPGPNLGQSATSVIRLKEGQVFEIVLQNARALNGAAEFHPWHVHGHSFWVVGRGEGIYDAETDVATYNLENPLLRDTATLWPLGWTALRMVAQPGVWLFHCHLTSHLIMGMSLALVVEPEVLGNPPAEIAFCGDLGSATSDNSGGNSTGSDGNEVSSTAAFHHGHGAGVVIITVIATFLSMIA